MVSLIIPHNNGGSSRSGRHNTKPVLLNGLRGAKQDPVLHEEVDVAQSAANTRVGGNKGLVPGAELGNLCLMPDARAAVGVDVLWVNLGIKELDDAFPLSLVDAGIPFHVEGPRHKRQAVPDLDRADERQVASEIGATEAQERDEQLDLPAVTAVFSSGGALKGRFEARVQGVDVDELVLFVLAFALENSNGMVNVDDLEPEGNGDVISISGLDEHGGLKSFHPIRELDVSLSYSRSRFLSREADFYQPISTVLVRLDDLPVDDKPASFKSPYEMRNAVADELNDLVLEVRVHDGLFPLGDVVRQHVVLPEFDDVHACSALELGDGLGLRHEALVVESEYDGAAAVLVKVAIDDARELRIQKVRPCLYDICLHELDLPVDERGL